MLDRLIDFLLSIIQMFQFWTVVNEYERGVVLRLGRFKREIGPGLTWCIPFYVDHVLVDNVVNRVVELGPQSLTTKDGKDVTVNAVVTASIKDIKKALLEVEGVDHALADACCAAVGEHVNDTDWTDLRGELSYDTLTKACRRQAFKYGIEIHRVQLKDLTRCRSLRILAGERNTALEMYKEKLRL